MKPIIIKTIDGETTTVSIKEISDIIQQVYEEGYQDGYKIGRSIKIDDLPITLPWTVNPTIEEIKRIEPTWVGDPFPTPYEIICKGEQKNDNA